MYVRVCMSEHASWLIQLQLSSFPTLPPSYDPHINVTYPQEDTAPISRDGGDMQDQKIYCLDDVFHCFL